MLNGVLAAGGPPAPPWARAAPVPIASATVAANIVFMSIDLLLEGADNMWSMAGKRNCRSSYQTSAKIDEPTGLESVAVRVCIAKSPAPPLEPARRFAFWGSAESEG